MDKFPSLNTIAVWLGSEKYKTFHEQYARAKRIQAEFMADEIIEISDDNSEDEIFTDEGKRMLNKEFVLRSRLRVDSRKWIAAKLLPKKYGDVAYDHKDNTADTLKALIDVIRSGN